MRVRTWVLVLLAGALATPGAAQTARGVSILELKVGGRAADRAVAATLSLRGRGSADAERAGRLFDLARELEEAGRDDLALVLHREIVARHPAAEMPSGIAGTTFAEESRARIDWLAGDRSWLATDFRKLHRGIASALSRRDAAAIAALAPPQLRVGPFRACPDGWRARGEIASELAKSGATAGALAFDGDDQAWFPVTMAGGATRMIVLGHARGCAEWQAYCYDETAAAPAR